MPKMKIPSTTSASQARHPYLGMDGMAQELQKLLSQDTLPLTPELVLKRAVDTARSRTCNLISAFNILNSLGSQDEDEVVIGRDALMWLSKQFATEADEIMTDLDHAQRAIAGEAYTASFARFGNCEI